MKKLSKKTNCRKENIEAYNIYQCACFCGSTCRIYSETDKTKNLDWKMGMQQKMELEA